MKKIAQSILLLCVLAFPLQEAAVAQTVQAGISSSGSTLIISAKASSAITGQTYSAGNLTIKWLTTDNVTLGAAVPTLGTWAADPFTTNQISGIYTYTVFTFVAGAAIPLNMNSGTEYELFRVPVNQTGHGTGIFWLAEHGFAIDWYFESGAGDITNTSTYFYADNVSATLPVELSTFKAAANGRSVQLRWTTATEVNSHSFEIEKLGKSGWSKVGEIAAGGNSNAPKSYTFADNVLSLAADSVSYRLKMIDNDGTFTYSGIVEAEIGVPLEYALSQNYPNPFNPETKIQYSLPSDARVTLTVYDVTGRELETIVNENRKAGYYEEKFGGSAYASGVYFYRITAESEGHVAFTQIKKMMMLR